MTPPTRVLVVGATGRIGRHVVEQASPGLDRVMFGVSGVAGGYLRVGLRGCHLDSAACRASIIAVIAADGSAPAPRR